MITQVYIERFRHGERDGDHSEFTSRVAALSYGHYMLRTYKYSVWVDGVEMTEAQLLGDTEVAGHVSEAIQCPSN